MKEVLENYRDAIKFVHDQTVFWMNRQKTPDEVTELISYVALTRQIVELVKLPKRLAEAPYLTEYYGTVSNAVR